VEIPIHETRFEYSAIHDLFCPDCKDKGDRREPHGSGYELFKKISMEIKGRTQEV